MPKPLIAAGLVALVLLVLSLLRIRVTVCLRESFSYRVTLFGIPILQYPKKVWWRTFSPRAARAYERRCDRKAQEKLAKKAARRKVRQEEKKPLADKTAAYLEKLRFARALLAALLRKTRKHVVLCVARLHVRVATGDAATTAILYGTVMSLLSPLFALLSRITRFKAREPDVAVIPDFLGERSDVDMRIELSITLARLIALATSLALSYLALRKHRRKHAHKGTSSKTLVPDDK